MTLNDGLRLVGAINVGIGMLLAVSGSVDKGIFSLIMAGLCIYCANHKEGR